MSALSASIETASLSLEADWRALEARADRSFFLSWPFVKTALETPGCPLLSVRILHGDEIVGLCLLWPVVEVRHAVLRVRQLRLNEYGASTRDCVPSEFAAPLAAAGEEGAVWTALMSALLKRDDWDELVVTNLLETDEARLSTLGLHLHRRAQAGSGRADLDALRARGVRDLDGYLALLSKSTRGAIARSIRLYAERGNIRLERAATAAEAQDWFGEIVKLQTAKWKSRGADGVGDRAYLETFSRRLIENGFAAGAVELLRVSAGEAAFAWIFNYVDRGKVLFNIGGFLREEDNRLKPGLVAHAFAIVDHLKAGMSVYDFLAGDDRYKTNLGQAGPNFVSIAAQRPRLMLRAEKALRAVKHKFQPPAARQEGAVQQS